MSAHSISLKIFEGETLDQSRFRKAVRLAGVYGAIFAVVSLFLLFFAPLQVRQAYAYSWLYATFFYFSIGAGAMFWVLLHHLANAGWGIAVRRVWENIATTLPLTILLVAPLIFVPDLREALFEWTAKFSSAKAAHPALPVRQALLKEHHDLLAAKYAYLNLPFWMTRYALFFLILGLGSLLLKKLSLKHDVTGGTKMTFFLRGLSSFGMFFFGLSVKFASFDWLKGLDYAWFSTMWGVSIFASCALNAMALTIIVVAKLRANGQLNGIVSSEHFHLMGRLMFAFVLFWAYVNYSQFMLIWYANITEETVYYLKRTTEGWYIMSLILVIGHFFVPFVYLLPASVKRDPSRLVKGASWMLVLHAINLYWIIIPERGPSMGVGLVYPNGWILDLIALTGVGALFFAYLVTIGFKGSLYPKRDPRLIESVTAQA